MKGGAGVRAPGGQWARLSFVAGWLLASIAPHVVCAQAADVPYVPTPRVVVEAMLEIAKVGRDDFLIDLGSGDGRIVITAAKKYGLRGFGVDLDGALVSEARREAQRQGVQDRVDFHARNLFITDIGKATVLTLYLFPRVNMELRPRILKELRPGTRVVSHEFDFGSWKPDAHVQVPVPGKSYGPPSSEVYLWVVPANAAGVWQWRLAGGDTLVDFEAAFEQTFQMLKGEGRAAGGPSRIESATLRGDEIAFALVADPGRRAIRHEFRGRIAGDTILGSARVAGAATEVDWRAMRVMRGTINIDATAATATVAARF